MNLNCLVAVILAMVLWSSLFALMISIVTLIKLDTFVENEEEIE